MLMNLFLLSFCCKFISVHREKKKRNINCILVNVFEERKEFLKVKLTYHVQIVDYRSSEIILIGSQYSKDRLEKVFISSNVPLNSFV